MIYGEAKAPSPAGVDALHVTTGCTCAISRQVLGAGEFSCAISGQVLVTGEVSCEKKMHLPGTCAL